MNKWTGKINEIHLREILVIAPLMILILSIGIWPAWIVNVINQTVMAWF